MQITITKRFAEFPFAHRQPFHDGHCAFIHGHNWDFEFTFRCEVPEEGTGFVIDFGKLKTLRQWLEHHFDHTLVLNENDPFLEDLRNGLTDVRPDANSPSSVELARIIAVPDCSCEGIAEYLITRVNGDFFTAGGVHAVPDAIKRVVEVTKVTVYEDSKNSATAILF